MSDPLFLPLRQLHSKTVVLAGNDIDTDQIVPARFMATTSREGMANALFHDWRFGRLATPEGHQLDRIDPATHRILIVGDNFGCGSSREHAAWALFDFGFRVVVSTAFADIFAGNAFRNGILTVGVSRAVRERLLINPGADLLVDLEAGTLSSPCLPAPEVFTTDPFARTCLLEGRDPLAWLVDAASNAASHPQRDIAPFADLGRLSTTGQLSDKRSPSNSN